VEAFCRNSKLLKGKQDFVACFALVCFHKCGSWYARKPPLLLTARGGLIAQHYFQPKAEKYQLSLFHLDYIKSYE